jgi:hypothetical protein
MCQNRLEELTRRTDSPSLAASFGVRLVSISSALTEMPAMARGSMLVRAQTGSRPRVALRCGNTIFSRPFWQS